MGQKLRSPLRRALQSDGTTSVIRVENISLELIQ